MGKKSDRNGELNYGHEKKEIHAGCFVKSRKMTEEKSSIIKKLMRKHGR